MGQVTCTELFIEVLHKLGVVVGQDVLEWEGEEEGGEVEEVLGRLAGVAPCGPSQGEAGGQIGERNDVSPVPLDEALDGIQGDAMTRVSGHELLGFSALFGLFRTTVFPLRFSLTGHNRSPPMSLMRLPMVAGLGQGSPFCTHQGWSR